LQGNIVYLNSKNNCVVAYEMQFCLCMWH